MQDALAHLSEVLDDLVDADLHDGEAVVGLVRQLERLGAVANRAMAAFEASRTWEAQGARSAGAWIASRCRLPVAEVKRRVRLGRGLRSMPATCAAWCAGDIGEAQVALLVRAHRGTPECFRRDEGLLLAQAAALSYRHACRAVAYWRQRADPDGTEADAAARRAARRLHLSETFEGVRVLDGVLDPVGGTIVATALRRIEDELFAADWAEARRRRGEGLTPADLARTPAQRRADALVEMARRASAAPTGARRPDPLVTVLVGYETLAGRICELAAGTVVTPGSVLGLLDEAYVERIVFDGPDRVMGVGARRRFFDGADRRAVEVRDRECCWEGCEEPAERCQVDHVLPWSAGGPTVADNGRLACGHHNRRRNGRRDPP